MKIRVTKADIKNGKRRCVSLCPVALALRRLRPLNRIHVSECQIAIGGKYYTVPEKVGKFINNYDNECSVKPFTFYLPI